MPPSWADNYKVLGLEQAHTLPLDYFRLKLAMELIGDSAFCI